MLVFMCSDLSKIAYVNKKQVDLHFKRRCSLNLFSKLPLCPM